MRVRPELLLFWLPSLPCNINTRSQSMARLLCILAFLAAVSVALAHMGIDPPEVMGGESTIVSLRIGHDCGDSTIGTTNFTIELPPGLDRVSVEQMAGWRTIIHKTTLPAPTSAEGTSGSDEVVEVVRKVTYLGFLPDDYYQLFNLRIRFPDEKGAEFYFKGYQDCHNQGTSLAWDSIPSEEEPKPRYPAVKVTVI